MLILDTCGLLWLSSDQSKLSQQTLTKINKANIVYISAITAFEIGIKCRSGKLLLPVPPSEWMTAVLKHHNVSVIPLNLEINIKSTELPLIHKDPCDRFIIATALLYSYPVITTDKRFTEYGVRIFN